MSDLYWIRYEQPADPDGCWREEVGYLQKFGPSSPRATFTLAQATEKAKAYEATSYTKSRFFVEPVTEHKSATASDPGDGRAKGGV